MRRAAAIVATVLQEISEQVQPGMTTADLDAYAERRIRELGASPSFKGYHGFPASICASLNDEVVHGIPNRKKIICFTVINVNIPKDFYYKYKKLQL